MAENVLHVEHVTMQFGGVVAVNDLSLDVNEGEIVALIGPNGAGKTTAFNVITGVYAPHQRTGFLPGETHGGKLSPGKDEETVSGRVPGKIQSGDFQDAGSDYGAGHRPHLPEYPAV